MPPVTRPPSAADEAGGARPAPPPASAPPTAAGLARRYMNEVLGAGCEAAAAELIADDVWVMGAGAPVTGRAELMRYIAYLHEVFPDLCVSILHEVERDSRAAVTFRMSGTQRGAFAGIPPRGAHFVATGVDVFDTRDGKITGINAVFDRDAQIRQLSTPFTETDRAP